MDQATVNLLEYGVLGSMIVILIVYIGVLRNDYKAAKTLEREQTQEAWKAMGDRHREERSECREITEKQFDTLANVMQENTSVMSELKVYIKQAIKNLS